MDIAIVAAADAQPLMLGWAAGLAPRAPDVVVGPRAPGFLLAATA